VRGSGETRRLEINGELETELIKYHWRMTDHEWDHLPRRERVIKTAVMRIINEHPELR
jgi:hypothetical protein